MSYDTTPSFGTAIALLTFVGIVTGFVLAALYVLVTR
jgi:hypothetical protein